MEGPGMMGCGGKMAKCSSVRTLELSVGEQNYWDTLLALCRHLPHLGTSTPKCQAEMGVEIIFVVSTSPIIDQAGTREDFLKSFQKTFPDGSWYLDGVVTLPAFQSRKDSTQVESDKANNKKQSVLFILLIFMANLLGCIESIKINLVLFLLY